MTAQNSDSARKPLVNHAWKTWKAALMPSNHPEGTCDDCGGPNICWYAEPELWAASVSRTGMILCPLCFAGRSKAAGTDASGIWKLVPVTRDLEETRITSL
jgi:hypothetical protein